MRQLISGIIIALCAVVFALQNTTPITIKFFIWSLPDTSMALVLVITMAIGLIVGMLFLAPGILKRNKTISDLRKKISTFEKEEKKPSTQATPAINKPIDEI